MASFDPTKSRRIDLEDVPDWFRDQYTQLQRERTRMVMDTVRRATLVRAQAAGFGGAFAGASVPFLGAAADGAVLLLLCLGALAGFVIARIDASQLGGGIIYAGPLIIATTLLEVVGSVSMFSLSPLANRFLFVWILYAVVGQVIALVAERARQEQLPF